MMNETSQNQQIGQYRKLIGLAADGDLSALKDRYAALQTRFREQLRSEDPAQAQKGQKNLFLLDQAYKALAEDIRTQQIEAHQRATKEAITSQTKLSIELYSLRVGFQILDGDRFFALETTRVETNVFGMRSKYTNNLVKTSWPSGKMVIYNDHFKLKCIFGSYDLDFNDIVAVTKVWYLPLYLSMKQKSDESIRINVFGIGLGKKLKELAPHFTARLKLDY